MKQLLLSDVYDFCRKANVLRTGFNCAEYYGFKYTAEECDKAISELFAARKMGAYVFAANTPPQKYMHMYIRNKLPVINHDSYILEIGPGELPLFYERDYPNWMGVDLNYDSKNNEIVFSGKHWGKNKYSKIVNGSWDNLNETVAKMGKQYDLVCGSHSFEHCYKPITALKYTCDILKPGGYLVIFVPDGHSTWEGNYDRTHTLYMVPEMVEDFVNSVEGFHLVECKQFRTNMDLVIIAQKI